MPASGGELSLIVRLRLRTKPRHQDLIGVLAQARRRHPDGAGSAIELPGCPHLADTARCWVLDLEAHLTPSCQRACKRLLHVEDRPCRNPKLLEARQPLLAGAAAQVGFDQP